MALAFFSFPELVYNFAGLRWEIKSKHSQFGRKAAVPQKTGHQPLPTGLLPVQEQRKGLLGARCAEPEP